MKNPSGFGACMSIMLLWLLVNSSCRQLRYHNLKPDRENQIVVLYKKSMSEKRKRNFRNLVQQDKGKFNIYKCKCGSQLEIWQGNKIANIISDTSVIKGEISPTSRTGVTGDDTVYLSLNLVDTLRDEGSSRGKMDYTAPQTDSQVIVAVLDTGIDTAMFNSDAYRNFLLRRREIPRVCGKQRYGGWNFVKGDRNFFDDNIGRHGTNVTGLILQEAVNNRVRILPLKTHDKDGTGNLFQSICALQYARKAGARLINTSWGSYGIPNRLFEQALRELNDEGIVMVSAAGNENQNISLNPFYPAAYSGRMGDANMHPNLISVTTVKPEDVCYTNYSPERVDVGAVGKAENCRFASPFSSSMQIGGSSFATPVITGMLTNYYPYTGSGTLKEQMLRAIDPLATVTSISKIRTGKGFKQR